MADAGRRPADSWLRLQSRLLDHTAEYLQDFSQLVAQGSLEVRAYIENYTSLLSDTVGEIGDWMLPDSPNRAEPETLVALCKEKVAAASGAQPVEIRIPVELFRDYAGDPEIHLSTSGLVRSARYPADAPLVLLPELHLSFLPEEVKRKDRRAAEMKVYNLPAVPSGAVYEGLVWGSYEKDGGRFPVAIVELTFT